jgi:hypothetical protein
MPGCMCGGRPKGGGRIASKLADHCANCSGVSTFFISAASFSCSASTRCCASRRIVSMASNRDDMISRTWRDCSSVRS